MFSSAINEDRKVLIGCLLGSFVAYHGIKYLWKSSKNGNDGEFVPIGTVFSYYCGKKGAKHGEIEDRHLLVFNGNTGVFYTARQKPKMVLLDVEVKSDTISVTLPDGRSAMARVSEVQKKRDIRPTYLFHNARQDGLDCGDDISRLLSDFLEESNVRMALYISGLHNERLTVTQQEWWQNPVPQRTDEIAFEDLGPYMIMTEGSIDELNSRLSEKVNAIRFRPQILVDRCTAFDEDKWDIVKIGEVEIQCYRPCDRCVLTTVDPETGNKNPANEPLKTLRQFRLAPEGPLRNVFKDSPLFGVNGGIIKEGYIHEGQVVYVKYKKSAF